MNKQKVIEELQGIRERLTGEVLQAYKERGSSFGEERFAVWRNRFIIFLDKTLPGESDKFNSKLNHLGYSFIKGETASQRFWREDGDVSLSFIESLILDIKNGEYKTKSTPPHISKKKKEKSNTVTKKVFIVHGHDGQLKIETARFIEKLGFKAIILHEQASGGKTIIEKIEACTNVGFAIVLYTPDDLGDLKENITNGDELKPRARQNVIFEHGYLIAKLGRKRVVPVVSGEIELPSDIKDIVHVKNTEWKLAIAIEMKNMGYEIDLNKIIGSKRIRA